MSTEIIESHREIIARLEDLGFVDDFRDFRPYFNKMAKYLPNSTEALMRFSIGLQVVARELLAQPALAPLGFSYQILASLTAVQAVDNGLIFSEDDFPTYNVLQQVDEVQIPENKLLTLNDAGRISQYARKNNLTVGLVHGHFRLLTPASIAYLINAFGQAHVVLVGLEKGERTRKYKGKEPLLSDEIRAIIFRILMPFCFWIDDQIEYSDEGYLELLKIVLPTLYIGQTGNPPEHKKVMRERAEKAGSTYVELLNLPSTSTTKFTEYLDEVTRGT